MTSCTSDVFCYYNKLDWFESEVWRDKVISKNICKVYEKYTSFEYTLMSGGYSQMQKKPKGNEKSM